MSGYEDQPIIPKCPVCNWTKKDGYFWTMWHDRWIPFWLIDHQYIRFLDSKPAYKTDGIKRSTYWHSHKEQLSMLEVDRIECGSCHTSFQKGLVEYKRIMEVFWDLWDEEKFLD